MKNSKYFPVVFMIALSGLLFCDLSYADTLDRLEESVDNNIKTWHIYFWISLVSIFAVGLLGAIIAVFQSLDQAKYKSYTIFFGAIISLCTFMSSSFLKGDFRLYSTIEQIGLLKQEELSSLVELYKHAQTPQNREELLTKINKKAEEIRSLENPSTLKASTQMAWLEFELINSAYAASPPDWINSLPEDSDYLYFIGTADGESIAGLDAIAKTDAIQSASNYMEKQFGPEAQKINAEKLAKFLADSAEPYSSYISSGDNKTYRSYSLIRISKNAMKTGAQLFGFENKVEIPEALLKKIDVSQRARDDYTARQTRLYEDIEDHAKSKLTSEQYSKYLTARQLRKEEKKYPEAILLLKGILQQSSDFYLGWYNLALAYDAKKEYTAAEEAYKKAIELEPSEPIRDATLYNSYGHLFYKQEKYQDAYIQYEKSLKLDPDNPRTQNNLIQVANKLKSK